MVTEIVSQEKGKLHPLGKNSCAILLPLFVQYFESKWGGGVYSNIHSLIQRKVDNMTKSLIMYNRKSPAAVDTKLRGSKVTWVVNGNRRGPA